MNKKQIEKSLKGQLETIKRSSEYCGIPDYIMAIVWSNLLILEELKTLNKEIK